MSKDTARKARTPEALGEDVEVCIDYLRTTGEEPEAANLMEALAARLAEVERERDNWKKEDRLAYWSVEHAQQQRDSAMAERDALREALRKAEDGDAANKQAERAAYERAARVSEQFTVKPDASIYPDVPFTEMNEASQMASHTTAQQIAAEIRALAEPASDGEEI